MTDVRRELPEQDERGDSAVWEIRDRDGKLHTVSGAFLGIGSSHRPWHKGHPGEEWAPKRVHCSTCRWTEIRLFRLDDGTFLVVNSGMSDVPGERDLTWITPVETPLEVVEFLAVTDRDSGRVTLPMPARRVLAQSARHDADIKDAYINSPVTR